MKYKVGNERTSTSANWKGGKHINSQGYMLVYCPEHPFADSEGYVREHRIVMERHIGRLLSPNERVHHTNEIKTDNRIENLRLFSSESEHQSTVPHGNDHFISKGRKKERWKEYYSEHRKEILNYATEYREKNREIINQRQNERRRKAKICVM